jgi:hypothetical protein
MRYGCGEFSLEIPEDWFDTTEDDHPFTLTKPHGNGALQFSAAMCRDGEVPSVDLPALKQLLEDFADAGSLSPLENSLKEAGEVLVVGGTFATHARFGGRAWYVSDGWNIAKITFVWEENVNAQELQEAEQIACSLRFSASDA